MESRTHRMKLVSVLVVATLLPQAVLACRCGPTDLSGFIVPAEVQLPSNARGLPWLGFPIMVSEGEMSQPRKTSFAVRRLDAEGAREVPFHLELADIPSASGGTLGSLVLVVPEAGLATGGLYEFVDYTGAGPRLVRARVSSTPLRFASEGEPRVRTWKSETADLTVATRSGSCSYRSRADQRGIEIELPEGVRPWEEALLYLFFVDGKPWRPTAHLCDGLPLGKSWVGPRKELFYTFCKADLGETSATPSLSPGLHRVEIIAWHPGTSEVLRVGTEITLGCPGACAG